MVQQYIANPYLIRGLKFDLRTYVLVASVAPLCVYVHNDGIVKFCSSEFTLEEAKLGDAFRHLANYAINKHNDSFDEATDEDAGRFAHPVV